MNTKMATSPTPSLDSIRGGVTNSIESYGEHNGYLSDSPLTLSGSSPPVSDSAICDSEFTVVSSGHGGSLTNGVSVVVGVNQHHPISASVSSSSSASSTSSSSSSSLSTSGLSGCGSTSSAASSNPPSSNGPGVIGSNLNGGGSSSGKGSPCALGLGNLGGLLTGVNVTTANGSSSVTPRCTACKSKQSDAVAKCFECNSFLCANCVTAHQFMHCFNGHNVCLIKGFDSAASAVNAATINPTAANDFKYSSSLTMMLQQQQQQHHQQQQQHQQLQKQPLSQLSKIVLNAHAAAAAASANSSVFADMTSDAQQQHHLHHGQQQPQQQEEHIFGMRYLNGSGNGGGSSGSVSSAQLFCHRHKHELLKFSCRTCCTLVCKDCVVLEHSGNANGVHHEIEHVQEHAVNINSNNNNPQQQLSESSSSLIQSLLADVRGKVGEIVSLVGNADQSVTKIKMQYQKAHNEVNETYQFFCSMLDERKQEMNKELESLYNSKITSNNVWLQRSKDLIEKSVQTCDALDRSGGIGGAKSINDVQMLRKTLELQLQQALQDLQLPFELEFMSNYQSIQAGVRNTFGYIRATNTDNCSNSNVGGSGKQPPIARPTQSHHIGGGGGHTGQDTRSNSSNNNNSNSNGGVLSGCNGLGLGSLVAANLLDNSVYAVGGVNGSNAAAALLGRSSAHHHANAFDDLLPKRYQHTSAGAFGNGSGVVSVSSLNPYEKWSNGGSDNIFANAASTTNGSNGHNHLSDPFGSAQLLSSLNAAAVAAVAAGSGSSASERNALVAAASTSSAGGSVASDSLISDLTSKLLTTAGLAGTSIYPPKSQIKRQKMIYHCKFGEFGVMEGQFTEPSGVAVNAQNDIIVADTNNHRIQIFDKEGRFKFQFGECGKRDSQLLYPNRVAVVRTSGDIIVTERSPTHQIQIYNQYGQFVRKFGANILQHPRGVTVDNKGRIIVVECKVMRVIIFDQNGNVLHKFGCSKHLEFPNGVVVNDKQEIFISDNRAHCVKVFNYEGQYLRQIGGEGVTNYPIGVGINANGEILIADNHNNFNLTIFTQDGQLVSALESKVKHAQCFDVALMDDGSVVLASKDYRLYIYRYVQVPPIGL